MCVYVYVCLYIDAHKPLTVTHFISIRVLEGHEAMITALTFSPDCAFLLSCSTSGDILLWDARYGHGKCLSSVTDAHDLGVLGCDFSPQYDAVGKCLTLNYSAKATFLDSVLSLNMLLELLSVILLIKLFT